MSNYVVTFDPSVNVGSRNKVQGAVVVANSVADAKALLDSKYGSDLDVSWENATYTAFAAGADLAGWSLRVQVRDATGAVVKADCTVVGAAAATVDTIAALMVIALNASGFIAGSAYNAGTNVLTVAQTTDNLGDQRVVVEFWPPVGTLGQKVSIPGFIGAITQQGLSNAALAVALAADAYTVPAVMKKFGDTAIGI